MSMTLEEFIKKAREKEEEKIKIIVSEIPSFGEVEFQRPSTNVMLKFQNDLVTSYKNIEISTDEENNEEEEEEKIKKVNTAELDMIKFAKTASSFIYHSCSMFRVNEIRELYKKLYPEDIPLEILGMNEVITVGIEVFNQFQGKKEIEEVQEAIKN